MQLVDKKTKQNNCGLTRGRLQRMVATGGAALLLGTSLPASAAEHVVSRQQFHAAVAKNQQAAMDDRAALLEVLGMTPARAAMSSAGIEYKQVQQAVAALDDATVARLADRARHVKDDFAAGALSNEMLTYIVIAIGAAVLVLVLVN